MLEKGSHSSTQLFGTQFSFCVSAFASSIFFMSVVLAFCFVFYVLLMYFDLVVITFHEDPNGHALQRNEFDFKDHSSCYHIYFITKLKVTELT